MEDTNFNIQLGIINTDKGVTVKNVPAHEFIEAFARHLKKGNKIAHPEWATYYKTGPQKDLSPYNADWLYVRAASIAYQLYIGGKSGVNTLRKHYGTKQRNGTCTEHSRKAAGKVIRHCLEQLEKATLVGPVESKEDGKTYVYGKALTKKGFTDMDRIAAAIAKDAKK
jgi:small subunit ribosomal protein S19e